MTYKQKTVFGMLLGLAVYASLTIAAICVALSVGVAAAKQIKAEWAEVSSALDETLN